MTGKEKAEKILQTKGSMTFCAKGCGYTEKVKELIAIGLAEGKPKWHDLRNNPNDLPTTEDLHNFSKYVLCALKFNDFVFYQVMNIHYPSKTWIVVDSDKNYSDKNVIAWCELPKFEE